MKVTPFQIFCGYYLGLDRDFRYRFFNLNSLASYYGMSVGELRAMMDEAGISPELTRHVNYNIAAAHATAQELAESGGEDVRVFARRTFEEFLQARGGYDAKRDFENVDYERILPDTKPPEPDE